MSRHTLDFIEAIEHLPEGAMLRLDNISWDEYEQLLGELGNQPSLRVTYDNGRVEIISPTYEHEKYKDFVHDLVRLLSLEIGVKLETRGSATHKRKRDQRGAEPDRCFYVQNVSAIIDKHRIDLNIDPPPDVVVEIDITSKSLDMLPIYASFSVPEIWRYDGKQARIYHLLNQSYVEADASLSFPILTAQTLTGFLEQSKTKGQSDALLAFREWVRAQIQS
ncbi:MAG TPA: Uma2 family endonuclease [Blastocatellia bacterium]|nr:Uma2 family endonuclease [Blastocatellia bacterium]